MFVAGVSTQKVGEVAETLTGVAPSASTVSRLNHTLTQQFDTWRERPLQGHWRILYLDGVYFTARHGDQTDSTVLLTALGFDLEGNKEILALRACAEESKDGWSCLLQDVRQRGATRATTAQFVGVRLPTFKTPLPNRFIGDDDSALCQKFLNIAKTE